MAAKKSKTDVSAYVDEFQGYFSAIERAQWTIGRRITELQLSDTEMTVLGQQLSPPVGLGSLKKYEKVYRTFSSEFPEGPKEFAWGVLSELSRVASDDAVQWRKGFLSAHPKATVSLASREVNKKLREDKLGRGPRFNMTGNLVLVGEQASSVVRIDGRLQGDNTGDLLLDGLTSAELVGPDKHGKFRLIFDAS